MSIKRAEIISEGRMAATIKCDVTGTQKEYGTGSLTIKSLTPKRGNDYLTGV